MNQFNKYALLLPKCISSIKNLAIFVLPFWRMFQWKFDHTLWFLQIDLFSFCFSKIKTDKKNNSKENHEKKNSKHERNICAKSELHIDDGITKDFMDGLPYIFFDWSVTITINYNTCTIIIVCTYVCMYVAIGDIYILASAEKKYFFIIIEST